MVCVCVCVCVCLSLSHYSHTVFFKKNIYLFLAVLDLHCCVRASSSCGERGLLFVAVLSLLIAMASLVEHGL